MIPPPEKINGHRSSEPDLIDRIAAALPAEVRADYYREMSHCQTLPESDEMLRILRAMQFLTILIEQAPGQVATEREKLAQILARSIEAIQVTHQASVAWQKQIEDRLTKLPAEIARGISPEAIAEKINESLRQEFAKSGIPETAQALSVASKQMKQATGEFQRTAGQLTNSYTGAVEEARRAVDQIRSSVAHATETARRAVDDIKQSFLLDYKYFISTLCGSALALGLILGYFSYIWLHPRPPELQPAAVQQQPIPANPPPSSGKPIRTKRTEPGASGRMQ